MKKLILIGLLVFGGYKLYQYVYVTYDQSPIGADGKPVTQLFVGSNCGQLCIEMEGMLKARNINYQLIDIGTPEGEKYGISQFPVTRVGKQKVMGTARYKLISVLAENYGDAALTSYESMAMQRHFDVHGKPIVVLYGTKWCGYCKRQREYFHEHKIAFVDLDVESNESAKWAYDTLHGGGYPMVYVGYRRFDGYRGQEISDAVAELL